MPADSLIENIRKQVSESVERVAKLGEWPEWIQPSTLLDRIPTADQRASGFDAGIACALDLIPRDKQKLSAKLHAAYTPEAVQQIRDEILDADEGLDPDSESVWWLAACDICREGGVDANDFLYQIADARDLSIATVRLSWAVNAWEQMAKQFTIVDGVALALQDGGMQAAYVFGHELAIQAMHKIWFVGTYHHTLGIPDDYPWTMLQDEDGRPLSGPVHGSKQFVKCATFEELAVVLNLARETLNVVSG